MKRQLAASNNRKRHPDYMNLRKKINGCKTPESLHRLKEVTLRFNKSVVNTKDKEDGTDLLVLWLRKFDELDQYNS